ncbi:serine hydrolase domain-containing protein [Aquibaculum arenosum]|uniref:Serine hydrolase n=1 Tax=Aquibaculum arenosum TaxID=3032591 RepID=A0ABT5YRH0_9PROT|nr:serine hydrolase domain-containing protein [Fodinicurvata sp. CAU 1616]MDF2097376.1 serine hydrolase [Fodinicurvata sp. CAU 1616]
MTSLKALASVGIIGLLVGGLPETSSAQDDLAELLAPLREAQALPALAAAVSRDGEIVAAGAVGTRVQGMELPVTVDDRFHIGSDTKAMTATILGSLVEQGALQWESQVGEVLGERVEDMNPALAEVTLTQLLSHSSGIPSDTAEFLELYFSPEAAELNLVEARLWAIEQVKQEAPVVPDGPSPFQYSNFGYLIAGAMAEAAAERPWEALIHEVIFDPLGMESAGLGPQATRGRYDAPVGHLAQEDGELTPILWGPAADVPALLGPAGAAHMSVLDFVRWGAWNAAPGDPNPAIVTRKTLDHLHRAQVRTPRRENPPPGTPDQGEYAMGWGVVTPPWADGPKLMHNGSNGMNLAKILVDPERELSIAVVTNAPGQAADEAAEQALEQLFARYGQ